MKIEGGFLTIPNYAYAFAKNEGVFAKVQQEQKVVLHQMFQMKQDET